MSKIYLTADRYIQETHVTLGKPGSDLENPELVLFSFERFFRKKNENNWFF